MSILLLGTFEFHLLVVEDLKYFELRNSWDIYSWFNGSDGMVLKLDKVVGSRVILDW